MQKGANQGWWLCKNVQTKGGDAAVEIADTGLGMSKEVLPNVFEPFFSTKPKDRGTGLGLASAYGIIKNHNGIIEVESEPGQGATFTIYLPSAKKSARPDTSLPRLKRIKTTGSETLLLIDDERMILEVGTEMLESLGYTVLPVDSGEAALEIYADQKDAVDLVIMDMVMPKMSGDDLYRRLKTIDANVKVLLSSGYSNEGGANKIVSQSCNGFIQKPFNLKQLSEKVREVLET